jgi:hypothetical protein
MQELRLQDVGGKAKSGTISREQRMEQLPRARAANASAFSMMKGINTGFNPAIMDNTFKSDSLGLHRNAILYQEQRPYHSKYPLSYYRPI